MPGADSRFKPPSANESLASDEEASQLELHLQRQLEEDVARIFDESIYTDLEVVCGKLKILTHSCILQARTNKFYHILQTILHVNIGRSAFDEIYSFISDTYTECNIKHQEKEILAYLKTLSLNTKEAVEEPEEFLTPKCISPYVEKALKKSISSSPSTELTKEYYALVPIEGNLLDKELIEQDVLSNAFQSIISSQIGDLDKVKGFQRNKPTSLALISSHSSKSVKHSNSCDILIKSHLKDESSCGTFTNIETKSLDIAAGQFTKTNQDIESNKTSDIVCKNTKLIDPLLDKSTDPAYSPDSLIADDPSSSSDYLSAAYTFSPGISSVFPQHLNVGINITKMENIFTSSDSGLENTGLLESLTSHKDITVTDMSLTESTLHDLTTDDGSNSHDSVSSPLVDKKISTALNIEVSLNSASCTSENNTSEDQSTRPKEMTCNSSKEEKEKQNEEIVILESSSLSSETGSWESVYPPRLTATDMCEKFIHNERRNFNEVEPKVSSKKADCDDFSHTSQSLVQKSPFKSSSCFIDAASLVDEEEHTIKIISDTNDISEIIASDVPIPMPSKPVPCSTNKVDISPSDWSENDNEDSLEQLDNKDPDSIQKDLSPTIFEMTPITEDSLCTNVFEPGQNKESEEMKETAIKEDLSNINSGKDDSISISTPLMTTPYNSIMSLKVSGLKQYESEESESDTTIVGQNLTNILKKYNESSPIISGGASVEDHLPNISSNSGSPLIRTYKKIENIPIVSGAYVPPLEAEVSKSPRPSCAPTWVVDMSTSSKSDVDTVHSKKPSDKMCDSLRSSSKNSSENCNKSRNSVDSDSSEKSSHKFYIDLSSLPDPIPPKTQNEPETANEKKNIFSMYIDFGEKSALKEAPHRLTSLNNKKSEAKITPKNNKNKMVYTPISVCSKLSDPNSTSTFEKYEVLCEDSNISISEIINLNEGNRRDTKSKELKNSESSKDPRAEEKNHRPEVKNHSDRSFQRNSRTTIHEESLKARITIFDETFYELEDESFVKLSDLDKPILKADPPVIKKPDKVVDERMTRSIPDNSWREQQNQGCTSRSNEIISSFHSENALSLNRLFPHLRTEFSRSMPGSLSSRTRSPLRLGVEQSPGDLDDQTSDTSEMSSVQSSFCRSIVENSTTEETSQASSLIGNCQSRLGQDLLRMFLEEIAPDVIVEVSGRRIKAHKCILSSRCQYFAGILSGGWVESAGNVIALPPFSFNVVHFALCHIYSGVSTIPDSISIVELATLADMLGLEGLKEAIMFTLKAKYCHHFHKPCAVCKAGVLECFPLCSVYGLDDLYRKCLKWIIKYFPWVWPTKAFATLPSELLEKCYQEIVINMTLENIINTVYGCGLTVEDLHHIRWGDIVARICRRLVHAAAHFIAPKLVTVLREIGTLPPDPPASAKQALDECMAAAIEWAPPDECCRAYALLAGVAREIRNHRFAKPDLITNGNPNNVPGQDNLLYVSAGSWVQQCEGALVRAAPRVCCTQAFAELPPELRARLRELGCIMYGQPQLPGRTLALQHRRSKNAHPKPNKTQPSTSRNLDIDHMRASFVPYAPKPATLVAPGVFKSSSNDLQDTKKMSRAAPPKVRTTKAQEERAKFNLSKANPSQERLNAKVNAAKPSFEHTKPRYLEPKIMPEMKKNVSTKKLVPKMISSSESSRNSSPIQARNLRTSRMKNRQANEGKTQALSQDSLATCSRPRTAEPSTDSLSESQTSNKYATYTKVRHTTKGSIESAAVKCTRHATAPNPSAVTNGKVKTKIPVYLNSLSKSYNTDNKSSCDVPSPQSKSFPAPKTSTATHSTASVPMRSKNYEKNSSCSLMNATKSSSAKMVTKIIKESPRSKTVTKNVKGNSNSRRPQRRAETDPQMEIPVMERSGTFLKDEPTFGDKTTNIDLDE
ncbi:uncharacterized protein LOC114359514 isoform X1 [Ostrinia furnacalis]|uniref:uncharacterized protein LOC114359514 isoform X1 n=1 Tax=Ostrinia furnacalis TaxID=93504 RepID=UPI00103D6759|nr:uncharacterized protein LOC114359514 isoform X1 [Ostrinia furnacalis]XP_028169748.1 uncharacterized protein LOC114359514 isoform X1 [Ostrinia furnacalis]